ncbi:ATP-binding protein [Halalkalibacter alkalisediminis]|uniref:histidine kinase n=1 Tax=Halalkalibacter alkalisediminis TaxID=935616 RepID=A0ABV6NEG8_9BACI|nr:ATP-binding protein [Halalkalibacter alkalisediminis]
MKQNIIQLTKMIQVSNQGHILYVYDEAESYIENAVSFIVTGMEQGHHLLIIDNKANYKLIYQRLQEVLSIREIDLIQYVDNYEFYCLFEDFQSESIVKHFTMLLEPLRDQEIPIRTWSNVVWKEQDDIISKLEEFENRADHCVREAKLISVCAYNGHQISASLQNRLLGNHEYFMTDGSLVKSSLYQKREVIPPFKYGKEEHQKMEGELKATKHQLQSFIQQNLDPILIFDRDDKLITVNKAFEDVFGWFKNEVLGLNANDIPSIPEEKRYEVNRNRSLGALGVNVDGYETVRITKDGRNLHVLLSSFSLLDKEGKFNGRAVIVRDITESKQAQDLLIKTEKLSIAGELAAGIAHEIRNPITSVKGFLQLLHSDHFEEKKKYYDIIKSEIDRIELILTELLMLSKPQVTHFETKDILIVIKDVITLLDAQAHLNNVQINTQFDSNEILVRCEENQFKQVCINMIKNAIESMPSGGELLIKAQSNMKDEIVISFIDQGIGISKSILSKLGQPFYTTKEKGTGLGFMVSKKIIENHNGSIVISSEEHKGTIIDVYLPIPK